MHRRSRTPWSLASLTLVALHAAGCKKEPPPPAPPPAAPTVSEPPVPAPATAATEPVALPFKTEAPPTPGGPPAAPPPKPKPDEGLSFRITDGRADDAAARPPPAPTQPIEDAAADKLLERVPQLDKQTGDEKPFAMRERSLPPPRTGKSVKTPFPPPIAPDVKPPVVEAKPLEVLRFSPEGEVTLAPNLSVTFSQPMVAVTSHKDTVAKGVPVTIEPEPPGNWRWVGAKTLLLDPAKRLPMATEFTVTVPAGTTSATGGKLEKDAKFTFKTPPPRLLSRWPEHGPQKLDPLILAFFDQAVDPAVVLQTTKAKAGWLNERKLRLATKEEIEADSNAKERTKSAEPGRFVAFKTEEPLPADTDISISFEAGTASAEGPRKTTEAQTWSFRTFGPFKIRHVRCHWDATKPCRPMSPINIEFTNPIDDDSFAAVEDGMVTVEPPIEGMKLVLSGNGISILGKTKGRTKYKVKIAGVALKDTFGQTLAGGSSDTLTYGTAEPMMWAGDAYFRVLDPAGKAEFQLFSINHKDYKLELYRAEPKDWPAFLDHYRNRNRYDKPPPPVPGKLVLQKTLSIDMTDDELTDTRVDLTAALVEGAGQIIVKIEPTKQPSEKWAKIEIVSWIQVTNIGLTALVDDENLLGLATSLVDGKRLDGVALSLWPEGTEVKTDKNGAATLELTSVPLNDRVRMLIGKRGADTAFIPENTYYWGGGSSWTKRSRSDWLSWFVFDDRHLYRPKEEVQLKGWVRQLEAGKKGLVKDTTSVGSKVRMRVVDSRNNEVWKGDMALSALGGFDGKFTLPDTMNLGHARVELTLEGGSGATGHVYSHGIEVQEFRRPEFEVKATASAGPHFVGGTGTATIAATYFAGGGLPDAEVVWRVTANPGWFSPPNRDGWAFGGSFAADVDPYEHDGPGYHRGYRPPRPPKNTQKTFTGKTDGGGSHTLRFDFDAVDPPTPTSLQAEATVVDVNRQTWAASTTLLVHPADVYVGLKHPRGFYLKGDTVEVEVLVADLEGKAVTGRTVTVESARYEWGSEKGRWRKLEKDKESCTVTSGADGALPKCSFVTKGGGELRITATTSDIKERKTATRQTIWVAGGDQPPKTKVELEQVKLTADKKDYAPGDAAKLLVEAPWFPAEGVLTVRRSGIVTTTHFSMTAATTTVEVPIESWQVPAVEVQVELMGSAVRAGADKKPDPTLPRRPAYASGATSLQVPARQQTLKVEVTPAAKSADPGSQTSVTVEVKDATGAAVPNAEVALVVVDESVLALTGHVFRDPMSWLYPFRSGDVKEAHLREHIVLASLDQLAKAMEEQKESEKMGDKGATGGAPPPPSPSAVAEAAPKARMAKAEAPGGGKDDEGGGASPIAVRSNFNPLAAFVPATPTDPSGKATLPFKLPDNLTRYRVVAYAISGATKAGKGESTLTARLPLMVRASPPRFLNFGDQFELPIVLQNQTDEPMTVDVAVKATGVSLTKGKGRRVNVPANDRVEVRFPASVTYVGTARFQIAAAAGARSDASKHELPVWTPATTEAFATYGTVDQGATAQPVALPNDVYTEFGGLEVTTSSTALQALTDAVLYLVAYPYDCAEQIASRMLAIVALRDVLSAFRAKGMPPAEEVATFVARDLKSLKSRQNGDGGFGFWRRGSETWPYLTVHVAHALVRAKLKGYEVDGGMLARAMTYLKNIERHYPSEYPEWVRRHITTYAVYVRNLNADPDVAKALQLIKEEGGIEKTGLEPLGFLLPVLSPSKDGAAQDMVKAIRKHLNNRVTETAGAAHFAVNYQDGAHLILSSDRRADGVLLDALIGDQPKADVIPKIVTGLLAHRKKGHWGNTQENAFVLLALDRYFNTYEKETPDFVARAWLGQDYAGEHTFKGRTTERHEIDIPMSWLAKKPAGEKQDLVLEKTGKGRMYYRIGMRYAPKSLRLEPSDHGFTLERRYEGVDKKDDVTRDADGVWHIKAGARVRVSLNMVAESRRYHVALVDPLPAGLEPVNPELRGSEAVPPKTPAATPSPGYGRGRWGYWSYWRWYEHTNLRDERVEAFCALLWEGVYEFSYVARATTPGRFVAPPTKAEEMYHPETFGRSASDLVVVE